MPHIRSEVISGKYVVQYIFAAAATAAVEPLINSIGVGWTFTICEFLTIARGNQGDGFLHVSRCFLRPYRWCLRLHDREMGT